MMQRRPCVLVFAGHDPSGGAGIGADIEAIAAQGAHALTVITALTVQDNNRVLAVHPVAADILLKQAQALIASIDIDAIKIGIVGSRANAEAIADVVRQLRVDQSDLPVVLDPVLASGLGDALARDDAVMAIQPLLQVATLITPNLPEAQRLSPDQDSSLQQAQALLRGQCLDVLLKGGHGSEECITNIWFNHHGQKEWQWPRLLGEFHGSGCTLAAAVAGQLAMGQSLADSVQLAQDYTQRSLQEAYAIAPGQLIPHRFFGAFLDEE